MNAQAAPPAPLNIEEWTLEEQQEAHRFLTSALEKKAGAKMPTAGADGPGDAPQPPLEPMAGASGDATVAPTDGTLTPRSEPGRLRQMLNFIVQR